MLSFLHKIKNIFKKENTDAEIVGEVKFHDDSTPYFTVKMHGCAVLVDVNAEDVVEKFTDKFSQKDIKNATKVFMKYRSLVRLVTIEKNSAILYNPKENTYQLIDLSDNLLLRNIEIDALGAEDAFKLGIHFERMRLEKDRKLFHLTKSRNNVTPLKLVESNDK